VIDDGDKHPVAQAKTGEQPTVLCQGPQNDASATILSCADKLLNVGSGQSASGKGGSGHTTDTVTAAYRTGTGGVAADLERWPLWLAVLLAFGGASSLLRRRLIPRAQRASRRVPRRTGGRKPE